MYPSHAELEVMYAERERVVARLASQSEISVSDIKGLDRIGRCSVASDHWTLCNQDAQQALLSDEHHFVRSCAVISQETRS